MTTEHITVGLDDSEASWTALRWVGARAADHAVDVRIVHAVDESDPVPTTVTDRLDDAALFIRTTATDASTATEVVRGPIARALVDAAATDDMLVIGAHRARILQSMLTGSLPERVATRASVPTVVVPDDWAPHDGPVVVGFTDDDHSEAAVRFAAAEANRTGRHLTIVTAWRLPVPVGGVRPVVLAEDPRLFEEAAEASLVTATRAARALAPNAEVHRVLTEGAAASALADVAVDAALVVVGRKHRTTVGGAVFGSTARALLHRTRTPVCVVPTAPSAEERR